MWKYGPFNHTPNWFGQYDPLAWLQRSWHDAHRGDDGHGEFYSGVPHHTPQWTYPVADNQNGHEPQPNWWGWGHNGGWDGGYTPEPTPEPPQWVNVLETRNPDGTGNNPDQDAWGSADTALTRLTYANYADGLGAPADGPNPREISNTVMAQEGDIPNSFGVSDLFTFFGQFIDHDIDLTHTGTTEKLSTIVPANDAIFDPSATLELDRSAFIDGTGVTGPREHANAITSFLDASNIYGSNPQLTELLRSDGGDGAYMRTSTGDYAPKLGEIRADNPGLTLTDEELVAGRATDDFYVAGDVRANENVALTSMHTIWLREHNNQVDRLKADHPDWSDEELFASARIIVEAEYQNVVYSEYLPLLLGADNIPGYDGYDPSVNPSIAHEFSTAAYRLGHSQLSSTLHRADEDGSTSEHGDLGLFQAFFTPTALVEGGGVDPLIRGLSAHLGQEVDTKIIDDVRNLLFGPPGEGSDLAVLNIMRGRDHGIPPLNDVRESLGLGRLDDFSDLTSDAQVAAKLASVYDNVDAVDLWVGGLAENKVEGSQLGGTFHTIVLDQFMRLRDGDRLYFEERLEDHPELLKEIRETSFSDIIKRTTDIDYLQDDVFLAHDRIGGTASADKLKGTENPDLIIGFEGNDKLHGRNGDDDLYGAEGRDTLKGGRGDDNLDGGADRDLLKGGRGEDVLTGGGGNDEMLGGKGADIFIFARGSGHDQVYDFDARFDKLDVSDYGFRNIEEIREASAREHYTTVLTLDEEAGDKVHLVGVKGSWLTEDTFIFDDDDGLIA
jgi:hypothetical protein